MTTAEVGSVVEIQVGETATAEEELLTATYVWGSSDAAADLQQLLGLTSDGWYGQGTQIAHLAVLNSRGLGTTGVPTPPPTTTAVPTTTAPPTTTAAPTTTAPPTTTAAISIPGQVEDLSVVPGNGTLAVSWSPPSTGGTASSYLLQWANNELANAGGEWTEADVSETNYVITGLTNGEPHTVWVYAYNSGGRGEGLSTGFAITPIAPTTTSTPIPRYELSEWEGKRYRWDPCGGTVWVGLNPNGHFDADWLVQWEQLFQTTTASLASATGLDFRYLGTTEMDPLQGPPSERQAVDILFVVEADVISSWGGGGSRYIDRHSVDDPVWNALTHVWTYINADSQLELQGGSLGFDQNRRLFMYYLAEATGVAALDVDIDSEIMSWAGWGSGSSWRDPDWGPGDRMALDLVGSSSGCIDR
jgi:hypothetical protein